jgi:hypothetical protein
LWKVASLNGVAPLRGWSLIEAPDEISKLSTSGLLLPQAASIIAVQPFSSFSLNFDPFCYLQPPNPNLNVIKFLLSNTDSKARRRAK